MISFKLGPFAADWLDKGVKVSVVDGTPWFPISSPRQAARELFWFGRSDYAVSLQSIVKQTRDFDAMFLHLQQRRDFSLLSLRPVLCPQGKCAAYDPGADLPIYKDRDHINPLWIVNHGDVFAAQAGIVAHQVGPLAVDLVAKPH